MSYHFEVVLISPEQRSQIIFALAHHRKGSIRVLFSQPQQKQFFSDVLLNLNVTNIVFSTFQEYFLQSAPGEESVVVLDAPEKFEIADQLFAKATAMSQRIILVLFRFNRKYLRMLPKHLSVESEILTFSANKFIGINDKLRELVDKSYQLNRAAFYAYGSFLNTYRANLLKRIFKTDEIDVSKLALSFGFATAPRVKEGKFLSVDAQKMKKKINLSKKKESRSKKQQTIEPQETPKTEKASVLKAKVKKIKKASH